MLRSLRPVAAVLLALAFVAGPASAACLHGADHEMPMEEMGHEMPMSEHAPADGPPNPGEMPPCHDEPATDAPAPAPPVDGCASACCAVQAAVETPAPLPTADAVVLLAVVARDVLAEPVLGPVPTPEGPPLRPRTRLHVELERFLI